MPLTSRSETLFLLPGLLCDAAAWAPQAAALDDIADIRTPDFFGHDSIAGMAEFVLGIAPARFALAGHSMGARVAFEIMRLAPQRVQRLAVLDTGIHPRRPGEAEKRQALVDLARHEGMAALAAAWLPPMLHPDRAHDEAFLQPLAAMVGRATPDIFAGQARALLNRPDAEPGLAAISCPMLIGVGRQDGWSPPAQHEAIARRVPHACYTIFEDSGHMAPLEAADAVNAALRAWLTAP